MKNYTLEEKLDLLVRYCDGKNEQINAIQQDYAEIKFCNSNINLSLNEDEEQALYRKREVLEIEINNKFKEIFNIE